MSERESIFTRIREALRVSAPPPGSGHGPVGAAPALPSQADRRRVLPVVPDTFEQQLELFRENAALLRAEFRVVDGSEEVAATLEALRDASQWQRVATHRGEMTQRHVSPLGLPIMMTDDNIDARELERCDVGITECDALVAQTGSVVVTSRSAGGRALSCLPPHHVVLARREQLVPDLPAAFELLASKYNGDPPSMISFITGPSRTGDIERILVLGAHGPKNLTILLMD
jgi:L-lactate dehydrogenase complex protein LldG